jgi:hypothetical protein
MPLLDGSSFGRMMRGSLSARAQQALSLRDASRREIFPDEEASAPDRSSPGLQTEPDRNCGSPACSGTWVMPWKNRRRPIFEGEWPCSQRCLEALIRSAIRREAGEGSGADEDASPHHHRVPLGLVLLAQGWITHPQLQTALQAQKRSGQGRIGDWLVQNCGLAEERITRGLGVQWNCPVLALDGFSPSAMALVMPKRFIAEFSVLPLRLAGTRMLYLAADNRRSPAVALALEQMTGLRVETGLLSESQFDTARERILSADSVPITMGLVADADELCVRVRNVLEQRQPIASKLVRVHQYYWLRLWLESGATTGIAKLPVSPEEVEDHLFMFGNG